MREFQPSATNAVNAEMNRMRKAGVRIYNFGSGDPAVSLHPAIVREAELAVLEKGSPYAPVGGLLELRQAAADWMNRRYGCKYGIEETVVTCGGKFALFAALAVLLDPGEEVVFAAPYWPSYPDIVRLAGGIPKPVAVTEDCAWKIKPEDLLQAVGKKTKIFLFNNGCNPTGALYTKEEVKALLDAAAKAGLWVISDEVYSEIVYDGAKYASCSSFPEHAARVVIVESCSKNFAMAGYRVGFAFGDPKIVKNMIAVQSQTTTGTSRVSQRAALGALTHSEPAAKLVRDAMDKRRRLFFKTYNELFGTNFPMPSSALYFFVKIEGSCEEILKKAHVALVPGAAFGMEGYARFAFSESEEDIVEGLNAFRD